MSKNIQIPLKLFIKCYLLLATDIDDFNGEMLKETKKGLETKFKAILKHDLYTTYKTAKTEKEQEIALKKYLTEIGVPSDAEFLKKNFS